MAGRSASVNLPPSRPEGHGGSAGPVSLAMADRPGLVCACYFFFAFFGGRVRAWVSAVSTHPEACSGVSRQAAGRLT